MTIRVTGIFRYPVKSCRPVSGDQMITIETKGFRLDRQWMIVDAQGNFMTQRQHPRMARIETEPKDCSLYLRVPGLTGGMPEIHVPYRDKWAKSDDVATVWKDDHCLVWDEGNTAAGLLSQFLGQQCRLVRMHSDDMRRSGSGKSRIAFQDAYPFLIISEASLEDLNNRMKMPLPMNRFRPNIIVSGCPAYAEDDWQTFRIGNVSFVGGPRCHRCIVTATDQETAKRGREPLWTLATYRREGTKVYFGKNADHTSIDEIRVGDDVHLG